MCVYTILYNVTPEENVRLIYEIYYSSEICCGHRIIFCTLQEGMWLTPVTSFKQIPDLLLCS
jgi:hypothetical protein